MSNPELNGKDVKQTKQNKGNPHPKAGPGRPKGSTNVMTKALKDMILGALDRAGGEDWLLEQAQVNPAAFMTLIGKVLPSEMQVTGKDGAAGIGIRIIRG